MNVSVTDLKAKLSEYLDRVKAGDEIVITERGEAVATIARLEGQEAWSARLRELVRKGVVRPPRKPLDVEAFLARPMVQLPPGCSVLRALLEERDEDYR